MDIAQALKVKLDSAAVLGDSFQVGTCQLIDFCLNLPGVGFCPQQQVSVSAGIAPVPARNRFGLFVAIRVFDLDLVQLVVPVAHVEQIGLLREQKVEG